MSHLEHLVYIEGAEKTKENGILFYKGLSPYRKYN